MVWRYGQTCSIQVQLGSAISFVLASISIILGGPKIASFRHWLKFRFSEFLLQKFYCDISDCEF